MRELAAGQSAIHALARSAQATVLLVDCGVAAPAGEPVKISPEVIDLRIGNGTHDVRQRPATTRARAALAIDSGVALGQSLADSGIDCIALGHIAEGAASILETACALLTGLPLNLLEPPHRPIAHALRDAHAHALADERDPLAILTALGGHAIGVMTGVILAAAANRVLVVLDDRGTSLAGLLAARLCPAVTGYLFASHLGQSAGHQQALYELGLTPLFDLGVARGQGEGAALALPALVDASARGTVAPR